MIVCTEIYFAQPGKPSKFHVHTVDAGSGVLNVQMEGPSKVKLYL